MANECDARCASTTQHSGIDIYFNGSRYSHFVGAKDLIHTREHVCVRVNTSNRIVYLQVHNVCSTLYM